MVHWGFIRKVGHLDMVTRREAEEKIAGLQAIIDTAKEAVQKGWNPIWELEAEISPKVK